MAKRKEPSKENENRVSQVVEVVEESDKSEALETIKEDAQEIEAVAEELGTQSAPPMEEEKEKQKEVVEELFQKEPPTIAPDFTENKRGSSRKFLVWAAIVISVALLVGGGLIAITGGSLSVPFVGEPTPTPTPASTPTPTPALNLNREELNIEVLNGGGTPGAASKIKAFLEEKGYTVTDVGNTEEYTYEQTEIYVKTEKQEYLALLEDDLKSDYNIGTTGATLSEDSSADAQVIVGKE